MHLVFTGFTIKSVDCVLSHEEKIIKGLKWQSHFKEFIPLYRLWRPL